MEPYALIPGAGPFAASADAFTALVAELEGPGAAGLTACELEDLLAERGREVQRQLLQDHLDLRAAREEQAAREQPRGCDGRGRDHAEPAGDRPRQAAGHAVRHGAGDPVRLAPAGGAQPAPGRCRVVAAGLPAVPRPGAAGRGGSGTRLFRGRARGDHPPLRAGDRQAAGRAGGGERRRRYRRVLRRPCPGAVHRLDAAGDLRRRQGDRDAARSAAPGHRESRRPAGPDADPAGGRGETEPQADGHLGLRLRRRAVPAPPARHHRPGPAAGTATARCGPGPEPRRNGWPGQWNTTRPR